MSTYMMTLNVLDSETSLATLKAGILAVAGHSASAPSIGQQSNQLQGSVPIVPHLCQRAYSDQPRPL
jgi:hypothetical protein